MILDYFAKPSDRRPLSSRRPPYVLGDVEIEDEASVWYGAVLRGDKGKITVARKANVQDNAVVHSGPGERVTSSARA